MSNKGIIGGFIVVVALIVAPIVIAFTGLRINTGSGSHIGYVTAVEKSGLIFKTGTAYIKTDTQSSQEDAYCVEDSKLLDELKTVASKKEKVEVDFMSVVSAGIANCAGESAIITGYTELE